VILDPEEVRRNLAAQPPERLPAKDLRPAAVLLPLLLRDDQEHVLFTQRTAWLPHHRGEICFPGGGRHPEDSDLAATALRETQEELGIAPAEVTLLGRLDDAISVHGYHVAAYVGRILGNRPYRINRGEIEEVIELPLARLRDPRIFRVEDWSHKGRRFPVHIYTVGGYQIWGLTAGILSNFLARLELN